MSLSCSRVRIKMTKRFEFPWCSLCPFPVSPRAVAVEVAVTQPCSCSGGNSSESENSEIPCTGNRFLRLTQEQKHCFENSFLHEGKKTSSNFLTANSKTGTNIKIL